MFTPFADLPLELVLLIIEHAGRSSVRHAPGWLAAALRVNSTFHRALLPILYRTVCITPSNFPTLARLPGSLRRNFDLTRHKLARLPRVGLFGHLSAVACDIPSFFALCHDAAFRPDVVVLTSRCEVRDVFGWLAPRFAGSTLCLVYPLMGVDAMGMQEGGWDGVRVRRIVLNRADAGLERKLLAAMPVLERVEFFDGNMGEGVDYDELIDWLESCPLL